MTALPQDVVAGLKARIAELEQRLQTNAAERDRALARQAAAEQDSARLSAALAISRDRQDASADILRTIADAPGDATRALYQIAETSARLFGAPSATIQVAEGDGWAQTIRVGESAKRVGAGVPASQLRIGGRNMPGVIVAENRQVHVPDLDNVDPAIADWPGIPFARAGGTRSMSGSPLRREGKAIGALIVYRDRLLPFTDEEMALQQIFADQAAIAIENARLFNETQEALERQTATADILKVIASSPSDVQPVFDAIAASVHQLLGGFSTGVFSIVGDMLHLSAFTATNPTADAALKASFPRPLSGEIWNDRIRNGETVMISDMETDPAVPESMRQTWRKRGFRSLLLVPLIRSQTTIGMISSTRVQPGTFTAHQVQLLQTFADQAVIAIENTRLFNEVRQRTVDLQESLQQQTAVGDVLKTISRSTFDLQPVLDTLVATAARLCDAEMAFIMRRQNEEYRAGAAVGYTEAYIEFLRTHPLTVDRGTITGRAVLEKRPVHILDVGTDPEYTLKESTTLAGQHTALGVPLMRENEPIGTIVLARKRIEPFTQKQIELVTTFADQAVIAIENVRLFNEVQAKARDLSEALTYQTGSASILNVIASSPTDVEPVLQAIVESACEVCEADDAAVLLRQGDDLYFRAHHGPIEINVEKWPITRGWTAGRALLDGKPIHLHDALSNEGREFPDSQALSLHTRSGIRTVLAIPLIRENERIGAIVLRRTEVRPFAEKQIILLQTFADQAVIALGNVKLFDEVQARTGELAKSLDELRATQDRLVQTEKLASLGQLTAGIAHEIKNPLNFINNFAALSAELTEELSETLAPAPLTEKTREEVDEITGTLKDNLQKVVQHGKRADSIVKNMLLHSRVGGGEHRPTDVNALVEESLNLAYHGARAEKPQFNVNLKHEFDPAAGTIEAFPQEITRVFLNLISNGFYAVAKRKEQTGAAEYEPVLVARTRDCGPHVEIRIRDNGTGIPPEVGEKMFNPFFTTKPAGEGTGLGLSMSHDIIVKQHGGTIDVETRPGEFTELTIRLPRKSNFKDTSRG